MSDPGADGAEQLESWIRSGDLDELVREVDRCGARGDWSHLLRVRDRCRAAGETGHQLWPAASYAEYRIALDGPPEIAASVVDGGHLAPGPLSEVVAQHHEWSDLDPHLPDGPTRAAVAHERVLRGDGTLAQDPACRAAAADDSDGLLLELHAWEHPHALADYRAHEARFPAPSLTPLTAGFTGRTRPPQPDGDDATDALLAPLRHWVAQSSGFIRACCVEGPGADAVATLVEGAGSTAGNAAGAGACPPGTPLVAARIEVGEAAALLAWAAASGAAHARRRGAAAGRFDAWWTLGVLAGVEHRWPLDVGESAAQLTWWRWGPPAGDVGWWCRIAVEDPDDGLSWAFEAVDRRRDAPVIS